MLYSRIYWDWWERSMEKYKIMRMLCMFDLPVETEEQRRAYRIFRKELIE